MVAASIHLTGTCSGTRVSRSASSCHTLRKTFMMEFTARDSPSSSGGYAVSLRHRPSLRIAPGIVVSIVQSWLGRSAAGCHFDISQALRPQRDTTDLLDVAPALRERRNEQPARNRHRLLDLARPRRSAGLTTLGCRALDRQTPVSTVKGWCRWRSRMTVTSWSGRRSSSARRLDGSTFVLEVVAVDVRSQTVAPFVAEQPPRQIADSTCRALVRHYIQTL